MVSCGLESFGGFNNRVGRGSCLMFCLENVIANLWKGRGVVLLCGKGYFGFCVLLLFYCPRM